MKTKYTIFRRGEMFYIQDSATGKQTSLKTKDETDAKSLLNTRNEAQRQPVLHPQRKPPSVIGVGSSAVLGITVVVNLYELINRAINLSEKSCLVHGLFVFPKSCDANLQRLSHSTRQIVTQLVARLVAPNCVGNDDVCSDKTVAFAAAYVVNGLASKLLKLAINSERERVVRDAGAISAVAVLGKKPPKINLNVAQPAVFRASVLAANRDDSELVIPHKRSDA